MGRFYFDGYWGIWVRRLLTTSSKRIDISLTPSSARTWDDIRAELIRVHFSPDKDKEFCKELPPEIYDEMIEQLGESQAYRLMAHNYIGEIGLSRLLDASKNDLGGGVSASQLLLELSNDTQ